MLAYDKLKQCLTLELKHHILFLLNVASCNANKLLLARGSVTLFSLSGFS